MLCSLILFSKHLLDSPIYDGLKVSSFECVTSFEFYLQFGALKNTSKFLTKSLDAGN